MRAGIKTPDQLLEWLALLPATRKISLECGAGSAEIAQFLTCRFSRSMAMDTRPVDVVGVKNIKTIQGTSNNLPFNNESVDLVISMQALHHFDVQSHLTEAHRVLKAGGIFAALCWGDIKLPRRIRSAYRDVFKTIDPFWEKTRKWVMTGYEGLAFEGDEITLPKSFMGRNLTIEELELEIFKMSATQKALLANVDIPEAHISDSECEAIGKFEVSWPILGRIFRR